jgi:hypothetical protein
MDQLPTLNSVLQSLNTAELINTKATFQKKIEKNNFFLEKSNPTTIIEESKFSPKMEQLTNSVSNLNLTASNLNTVSNAQFVPIQTPLIELPTMPATLITPLPLELPPVIPTVPIVTSETGPAKITVKTPIQTVLENKSPYSREQLSVMKKPELEAILTKMGLRKSGNKPELVERILTGDTVKTPIKTPTAVTINNPVEVTSNIPIPVTPIPTAGITPVVAGSIQKYTREQLEAKGMKKENLQAILISLGAKKKTGNKPDLVNMILEIQQKLG